MRGLLVQVDARKRVLGERLVDLGMDEVRGVQGLLFLLLNCILGGRRLSGGLGVRGEMRVRGSGNLSLRRMAITLDHARPGDRQEVEGLTVPSDPIFPRNVVVEVEF